MGVEAQRHAEYLIIPCVFQKKDEPCQSANVEQEWFAPVFFIKTTDHCRIISVLWRNHHAYYRNGVLNEDGDGVYSVEASKNEYLVKCSVVIDEESLKTLYGELWPDLTTLVAFLSENRREDLKLVKTLLKI
ncbi:hypothetical protein Zmor_003114 [Zophobas morio]|uniref:Uncharacterized protein n=1 Tax=Zophobas morio TaxID=2755281 RepID=A0AA38HKX5_9CUCU|nr:hypothetical protein Zmor_003114 [Zophobas morio]